MRFGYSGDGNSFESWFAWYPVRNNNGQWIWLENVARRWNHGYGYVYRYDLKMAAQVIIPVEITINTTTVEQIMDDANRGIPIVDTKILAKLCERFLEQAQTIKNQNNVISSLR